MQRADLIVVYASDNRGTLQLGVAIYSLFSTAKENTAYKVYVLSLGISDVNRDRIGKLATETYARHSVVFLEVSESIASFGLPETEKWPVATWSRIFIPDFLAGESGRVLYCDIDTLVCQDTQELFRVDLKGKAAGVVLEHPSHKNSHFNERLDIPLVCPGYFNAGVMLMDIDVFREKKLVARILDFAETHRDRLTCLDQDALNGALCDEVEPMHHKWNWHDGLTRLLLKQRSSLGMLRGATLEVAVEAALSPGILHYQGSNKPWRYNYRIERGRYKEALVKSGFGESRLPGWSLPKWLKSVAYAPIYWLTWLKIKHLHSKFQAKRKFEAQL